MRIFKYQLDLTDIQTIQIQRPIKILSAQIQSGRICVWALVDEESKFTRGVEFIIIGTGNPIESDLLDGFKYLSTIQDESFVWHIFVEKL